MSIFEDTNPHLLKQLLSEIEARMTALPDFQRDFVWDPNATQELIISIANNYPAGSLLRIRNTHDLFAKREVEGAPLIAGYTPTYLILDGQQRLTSLYQAFYGRGDHRFYVNLEKFLSGKDLEECVFHLKATSARAKLLEKQDIQAKELILPLSVLEGGTGGFSKWSRYVKRTKPSGEQAQLEEDLNDKVEEKWVKTIDAYLFPVVTLSDATSAEAVCTIFETLNRTGVKLSVFELLTARFWPKGINLRQLLEDAENRHPILKDFEVDPYYLLQIVSLVSRNTPSCKRGDVLNLDANDVNLWWDSSVKGLADGLQLLKEDCGILAVKWVPYYTALPALGAVLAKHTPQGSSMAAANRNNLIRCFWCAVFGQAYENAPNSQAAKDTAELLVWLQGGSEPDTVKDFKFDPYNLRDTTPRQRAVYRGVISLILSRGPRDFYFGNRMNYNIIRNENVDDHHIFPQDYLNKQSVSSSLRDSVLNRTLIDRKTNIRISNHAPSIYLSQVETDLGAAKYQALLDSHLLPSDVLSPLRNDDFTGFMDWRQDAIWQEIQRVTR